MKSLITNPILKSAACALALTGLAMTTQAQTPLYFVNGVGGTGGGTAGISVTPGISPVGSSSLTDLGATANLSFGTGPNGVAGESIVNAATGQPGNQVLAGTLGAASSLSSFTLTMWVNQNTLTLNNYRILEMSAGSPPTGATADGTKLFFGLNAGGGLQFYVNNVNGNTIATDIATANTWNNAGTLGALAANKWYFEAVTYDTVAGTALLYSGDQTSATTLAYTYGANVTTAGNLDLTAASSIALLDRFNNGRNYPGQGDDFSIYSGALTQAQLDAIRLTQVTPVPEPATMTMLGLGSLVGIMALRRRQSLK
jgi:Concanavalin A-like lectin/glucanases superfamily/PEP-CTERM motif